MKKNLLSKTLLFLVFVFAGNLVEAQVLWYGDPDKDVRTVFRRLDPDGNRNPSGNDCVDDPNNPPTVSTPTDGTYGKYWRLKKPTSRKRAEFARTNGFIPQEGQDYFIGWRWRVKSTPNLNNDIAVFQWKAEGGLDVNKQNYPFNMEYDGNELTVNAYGPGDPDWNRPGGIRKRKTTIWKGAVNEGSWVSFVFRVNVDKDFDSTNGRFRGFIEFWFNGSKQNLINSNFDEYQVVLSGDRKRAYHRTNDGSQVYMKWGSYNQQACNFEVTTDFDDMRVAETYEEARPTPAASNGGGGTGSLNGNFYFKNVATGNYLDSDGTTIRTSSNASGSDKQWRLVASANGYYNIDNLFAGRGVLDTDGNKVVKGTTIQPVSTPDDKEWSVESLGNNNYRFKNRFSGRGYLAARTADGRVEHTPWNGSRAQWTLQRVATSAKARINVVEETDDEIDGISVYPNPANDVLSLSGESTVGTNARIYDAGGNTVSSPKINRDEQQSSFNVSDLPKGIYILEVETAAAPIRKKFIKE